MPQKSNDPSNPWSWSPFGTSGDFLEPTPYNPKRKRRVIPEQDKLFSVQKNLYKMTNSFVSMHQDGVFDKNPDDARKMKRQMDNAYRMIRQYLLDHAEA